MIEVRRQADRHTVYNMRTRCKRETYTEFHIFHADIFWISADSNT